MNTQGSSSVAVEVMNKKRAFHESIIAKEAKLKQQKESLAQGSKPEEPEPQDAGEEEESQPKPKRLRAKQKKTNNFVDENFFLSSFQSSNQYAEKGYP